MALQVNKTTLAGLALGGGGVVDLVKPDVTWLLDGCPHPRPDSVDELVAIGVIVTALALWHWLTNRDPKITEELPIGVIGSVTANTQKQGDTQS